MPRAESDTSNFVINTVSIQHSLNLWPCWVMYSSFLLKVNVFLTGIIFKNTTGNPFQSKFCLLLLCLRLGN